jgi:hypothetical protein
MKPPAITRVTIQAHQSPIKAALSARGWCTNKAAVIPTEMLYSDAFHSLGASSLKVLVRFLQKRNFWFEGKGKKRKTHYDSTGIPFSYVEALIFGISTSSFNRALSELIEKGFIRINHRGSGLHKDFSTYDLVEDYKTWTPGEIIRRREKAIAYSRGFSEVNSKRATNTTVINNCCQQSQTTVEAKKSGD